MLTQGALALQERALLAQQQRGHIALRFQGALESAFDHYHLTRVRRQLPWVAGSAVVFVLAYALLDFFMTPLGWMTLPLRIAAFVGLLLCYPLMISERVGTAWSWAAYGAAYLISGLSIIAVIYLNISQGVNLPYDGMFLLFCYGYFLLGMPWRLTVSLSWLQLAVFLILGRFFDVPADVLAYQGLFLGCVNLIGSFGSYLLEHSLRSSWLNLRLLELAREQAETENARKLRLLAAASHDLRQPLNAMGLYAEHLSELHPDATTQKISQRLRESVGQLGRMLQSLLDFTRLTLPGQLSVQRAALEVRPFLARLLHEHQDEAGSTVLRLDCPENLWVLTDAALFERLLRNLLSNALRHADARLLLLSAHVAAEDQIEIRVRDDGRGLSVDEQAQVFEEFRQLNNPGRLAERGLGLGLAIVQQLAQLLAHPLQLDSAPGSGSCFRLWLPALAAPAHEVAVAQTPSGLQGCVLLIEDDEAGREALVGLLSRWGCQVLPCTDLISAQQALQNHPVDMLLSDFRLGLALDGLQVLEQLREQVGQMLPALLITAEVTPALSERAAHAHVALLAKPVMPARLRQAIARGLHARQGMTTPSLEV
ncbi:hybrid sensor histidine kinase/response regulator [Atopomonas sediminilitoris]|uniref:hybrid sensor histidine kinase/response regulator n=1 Tax=Atopomonas sediminilitoris TaxID=2919919 RepID=UPI001F4EE51A|nr:hybrid sensor histidine kinase/response regulator [Atopomonas sediminilitoris]